MRVETRINTAREPADQPLGTTLSWRRGHLDYARSEGNARHPSAHAEHAAAQDLELGIDRLNTGERLALAVSIRWLLTSRLRHLEEGTCTMADNTFRHRAEHAPPCYHGPSWPVALRGHLAHGASGGLQPGQNERATPAMALTRGPAHPDSHAKAQHLGHPWVPGLPGTRLRPPATTVRRGPGAAQGGSTT